MCSNHSKYDGLIVFSCFLNFMFFMVSGVVLGVILRDFGIPWVIFWGDKRWRDNLIDEMSRGPFLAKRVLESEAP